MLRPAENRCCDSPFSGTTSRPTKPRVKGEALAEARRRSGLSIRAVMVCCWAQGGLFTRASPSVTRRAALQAQPFSTCICSRIICASSTVYRMSSSRPSTTVSGSTADCRWKSPLPRAKAVGLKISSKDIPLNLLCLTFGPLLYGASLGTVAAIVIFQFCLNNRIASRRPADRGEEHPGLCEGRATSGLDACLHSLVAGLADHKPSACTGRRSGVLSLSTLNIVQFPVGGSTRHAGYRVAPRK